MIEVAGAMGRVLLLVWSGRPSASRMKPIWVRPVAAALLRLPYLSSADFGVSNSVEYASTRAQPEPCYHLA
jgi:hypothetical protein